MLLGRSVQRECKAVLDLILVENYQGSNRVEMKKI